MGKIKVVPRPPIVAVLGHVDHGKTTLLDKIRQSNIAAREAGGITQSIGAWQVKTKEDRAITFIDTPGHEAFAKMRSRGAQVSDIVVLVVAADDGVMPQTEESLKSISAAKTPFIVALTKVDLKSADPERVKNQLVDKGVLLEGRGGDVVAVEVSGVTGAGVETLLEMIELVAELQEISGKPDAPLAAPVIETLIDSRRGPVVRVVVREGTLRIADSVEAEGISARVRGLFDEKEKPIKEALPGMPAEILGFEKLPPMGAVIKHTSVGTEEKPEKTKIEIPKISGFAIILKADTAGSLEALMEKLSDKVSILQKEVGDISESDVLLAEVSGTAIVGFNVRASREVQKLARDSGIKIYTYRVIYELLQDVEKWARESQAEKTGVLGKLQVVAEFPYNKKRVAGCRVLAGRVVKSDRLRLIREEKEVGTARIISMKKQKEEVSRADMGDEVGILFEPQFDFKVGDMLESVLPSQTPAKT